MQPTQCWVRQRRRRRELGVVGRWVGGRYSSETADERL
jgi:hypothetical protein